MRSFFSVFIVTLLLISCSLPGTQSESGVGTDSTMVFENDQLHMLVPKSWTPAKNTEIPTPRSGNIVAAYISPDVKYGFSNNLIIMQDTLTSIITSAKYSELNQLQTTKNYLEYTKLQDEDFTFSDAEKSKLYVFEARYNQTTPRMKFIQTARVCGTHVYLLHVSIALDKTPDNYIELFRTFTCK